LNIVVCVKQVPDTTAERRLTAEFRLDRAHVENVLNPFDEYAIEAALRIKEAQGGTPIITILCVGPETATEAIRKALAMGADAGILITDPAIAGSDSLGTAHLLAQAIKKLPYDLVMTGMQSTDARTGQVPAAVADFLDLPMLTLAAKIEVSEGAVRIHRQHEAGVLVLEAAMPCLVSVTKAIGEPRYPSLKGIMQAKKKEIVRWTLTDIGVDASLVGTNNAHTRVIGTSKPRARGQAIIIKDSPEVAAHRLADYLSDIKAF